MSASFKTSFAETLLDGVTGAKVQITATDVHGNTKSIVGLERANFYGSLAGKLDSQTIFTSAIAFQLGELSGFATSLGTVATSVVTLIQRIAEDPLFVVETIRQLIEVVRNLSAEVLDRIVESAITQFQQKQDRNNPYEQTEQLYGEYESGWYIGYAAGFLAKTAVGASATKALKSTKTVQTITRRLSSTRVGSVLGKVDSVRDAAKARVATTIVRSADDVASGIVSRARTVGSTYRLWRVQRAIDRSDFDSLPDAQQDRLARVLNRHGPEGARLIDDLRESDQLDDFLELGGCSVGGVSTVATGGCPLIPDSLVNAFEDFDADQRRTVIDLYEGDRLRDDLFATSAQQAKLYKLLDRNPDLSADEIRTLQRALDNQGSGLVAGRFSFASQVDRIDSVTEGVADSSGARGLIVKAERGGVKLDVRFPRNADGDYDGDTYIRSRLESDESLEDGILTGVSRGQLGERLDTAVAESRGYEVVADFDKGSASETGVDLIARDPDTGEYVILETKFLSKGGLSRTDLGTPEKGRQMSDAWIRESLREEIDKPPSDQTIDETTAREILADLNDRESSVRKEFVYFQDREGTATTVTNSFIQAVTGRTDNIEGDSVPYGGIDSVTIVKTNGVINTVRTQSTTALAQPQAITATNEAIRFTATG